MASRHNSGYGRRIKRPMASARKFSRADKQKARKVFSVESPRSRSQDLVRLAEIAPNLQAWLKAPNRFDIPGVDSPDPQLIFSHKNNREKAQDLARLASKAPLEVWIKDTSEHDIEGVDTPKSKKKTQRFKVINKEIADKRKKVEAKAKEELEKAVKTEKVEKKLELQAEKIKDEADSPILGRKLPSHEEIVEKATELFMKGQAKVEGLGDNLPEIEELREGGFLLQAQIELMRDPGNAASAEVLRYIDSLKSELEPLGFSIIPMEGF